MHAESATWKPRWLHPQRGAAAVELALVLPLLLFFFGIAVDFSRVFYYSQVITDCARNGAIYASDPKSPAHNLYKTVQDAALVDAGNLSPQPTVISTTGKDSAGRTYVQVTVTWEFRTVTGFPGLPKSTILTRTTQVCMAP